MMNKFPANSPKWLIKKINEKGGKVTFYDFMDIVLNDPNNGYYGSGKANIGINGDFVTSPSLTGDFSYFLSIQIEEWLEQIKNSNKFKGDFTILEFGSGKGCLIKGIIEYFIKNNKKILQKPQTAKGNPRTSKIYLDFRTFSSQNQHIFTNNF